MFLLRELRRLMKMPIILVVNLRFVVVVAAASFVSVVSDYSWRQTHKRFKRRL